MRYSLVSRGDRRLDEVVCGGMNHDGFWPSAAATRNARLPHAPHASMPGYLRVRRLILPGIAGGEDLDIVSIFEARKHQAGKLDEAGVHKVECESCPGAGSCGGMLPQHHVQRIEAMGHVAPFLMPAIPLFPQRRRRDVSAGYALVPLSSRGIKPRDIINRKSLENAYTFVLALGGSNQRGAAPDGDCREAEVEWTLADLDRLGDKVRTLRPEAGRPVRHERPAPRRRHSAGDEGAARSGSECTATADGDGHDAGREPRRRREHLPQEARGLFIHSTNRCTRRAISWC